MEGSVIPHSTIVGTQSDIFMDFDYIDELLLEGCWLEANGSEFQNFDSSTPFSPFEPSFNWPTLESNNGESGPSRINDDQEEWQLSSFPENLSISLSQGQNRNLNSIPSLHEGSEQIKRWWIGPRASTSVMDRLSRAIGYIKECSIDKNVLIQVWIPVNRGGKRVLTTNEQPVLLDLNCPSLAHYREISVNYQFPADEDSEEAMGMPGRVFTSKVPEWTPDVRFFTRDEYPRVGHAQKYDVRGTLAVPVLEQGSHSCLGVIEVVLTKQKIKYRPELESVCKALEAVDLRSSEESSTRNIKTRDLSYQAALPEILEVLRHTCTAHGLPLAQTWVPCILLGKKGCRHSDENLNNCVSPIDSACYIGNPDIQGFNEACSEYHLLKGQGIVGKAFKTNQPCFSPDITACNRTEYPLSHHARMFGLRAAVAIRLRSTLTGLVDFVLEFFLPFQCTDPEEQKKLLTSLSDIIQNVCWTLRVVMDKELEEESAALRPYSSQVHHQGSGSDVSLVENQKKEIDTFAESSQVILNQPVSNSREGFVFAANPCTSGDDSSLCTNKTREKRVKAEKAITLQVLRQHFAGSLKDAAKKLGVCPTTLKRICRHHGIQRWPSRQIKKVGHSLQKMKRVIDSVHGASGTLQIDSFYSNFPELTSPNASRISNSKFNDHNIKLPLSVSPSSSCSQSSSLSHSCSGKNLNSNTSQENPTVQSIVSFSEPSKTEVLLGFVKKTEERDGPRIKVVFGEDAIRFRMKNKWRYIDLLEEISRRFGVSYESGFHLKYLDDDAEWVLLTCDADLDECIDVCRSTRNEIIKLTFSRDSR